MNSAEFLKAAIRIQEERGKEYDKPDGERSMAAAVIAYNAITGQNITEANGWLLMQCVKDVRLFNAPGFHQDSALDCTSFSSLKAEAKAREG